MANRTVVNSATVWQTECQLRTTISCFKHALLSEHSALCLFRVCSKDNRLGGAATVHHHVAQTSGVTAAQHNAAHVCDAIIDCEHGRRFLVIHCDERLFITIYKQKTPSVLHCTMFVP
jgi:hypothetical protein